MFSTKACRRLFLLLCLLNSLPLWALTSDKDQPMHLEADSVSIDDASGVSLYEGNVVITQGSLKLWADRLWIHRKSGKTEKIVSEGNPTHFQQQMDGSGELVRGHALKAEFLIDRDVLLLYDNAVLEQGPDQFRSDRILYNRASAQVNAGTSAEGKERVRVIIEPQKKTTP